MSIIPMIGRCTYGQSRGTTNPLHVFRINKNGTIDTIFKSDMEKTVDFELITNYTVDGNTKDCEDAIGVDRKVWQARVRELKTFVKSFR